MNDQGSHTKAIANRKNYVRTKTCLESALLRLERGHLGRFDAARIHSGQSRSAYFSTYLLPLAEAVSFRWHDIERLRADSGISLPTFLARAIDAELIASRENSAECNCSSEFDQLFGPAD